MTIALTPDSCVVFDLDDTIYKEIDFVRSGLRAAARKVCAVNSHAYYERLLELYESHSARVFDALLAELPVPSCSAADLIAEYRDHVPSLELPPSRRATLEALRSAGCVLGILTDGRSITQRNKLTALGISHLFDEVVISEEFGSMKPDPRNYTVFSARFPGRPMVYIGDNMKKDFIVPRALGWLTCCVRDDGRHVHSQLSDIPDAHKPHEFIDDIADIEVISR